jgi:hypothetical protein
VRGDIADIVLRPDHAPADLRGGSPGGSTVDSGEYGQTTRVGEVASEG